MDKAKGFLHFPRKEPVKRPIEERIKDWDVFYRPASKDYLSTQSARCMDCGIPFCHQGCPLGNLIPEWNEHVFNGDWEQAYRSLAQTNNFPEFTGWLCPAPCEDVCVLELENQPVSIKEIEKAIIERAFNEGWVKAYPPKVRTGKKVAIVGSGPAGLAAAQELNGAGHAVVVYERDDRIGGLIRYGIPDFKMHKTYIDRRIEILKEEGISFETGCYIGVDLTLEQLQKNFDAILLAAGALKQKDVTVPGRDLNGIHFAMEYLTQQNKLLLGDSIPNDRLITAKGKNVIILGGGDTGSDCYGTAVRQGAKSVIQFQYHPRPPLIRDQDTNPWPEPAHILRSNPVYEEGGERYFSFLSKEFFGEKGTLTQLKVVHVNVKRSSDGRFDVYEVPNTEHVHNVDLAIIATGFQGPDCQELVKQGNFTLTKDHCIHKNQQWMTNVPGVFVAGDMQRGASLVVWAIADGRQAAASIHDFLERN